MCRQRATSGLQDSGSNAPTPSPSASGIPAKSQLCQELPTADIPLYIFGAFLGLGRRLASGALPGVSAFLLPASLRTSAAPYFRLGRCDHQYWRLQAPFEQLRARFYRDVAHRIVGVTAKLSQLESVPEPLQAFEREFECNGGYVQMIALRFHGWLLTTAHGCTVRSIAPCSSWMARQV